MNAQEVLRSLVEQIKDKEGSQGLIILEARYGHLTSTTTTMKIQLKLLMLLYHYKLL